MQVNKVIKHNAQFADIQFSIKVYIERLFTNISNILMLLNYIKKGKLILGILTRVHLSRLIQK